MRSNALIASKRRFVAGLISLAFGGLSGGALAGAGSEGAVTITLENDVFTKSDNNYTNGVGIAWVSGAIDPTGEGLLSSWAQFWSFLPFVANDGSTTYASWSFAQEMNTPDKIQNPNPPMDDQPYSGILYVDSTLYSYKQGWAHAWQLKLGVVGPASHADDVQSRFHEMIGADKPQGWHTQLPNEAVVNVTYTVAHLAAEGRTAGAMEWRVVPVGTVGVGNYFTGAGLGVYGEVGWNLVDALSISALRSGFNAASTVGVRPLNRWSVSFFGGVGAYGVAYYLPLDGTMFRHSRSVDSDPVVGMGSFGFCVRHDQLVVSFARTLLSETFKTERNGTDFGTLSASWIF